MVLLNCQLPCLVVSCGPLQCTILATPLWPKTWVWTPYFRMQFGRDIVKHRFFNNAALICIKNDTWDMLLTCWQHSKSFSVYFFTDLVIPIKNIIISRGYTVHILPMRLIAETTSEVSIRTICAVCISEVSTRTMCCVYHLSAKWYIIS